MILFTNIIQNFTQSNDRSYIYFTTKKKNAQKEMKTFLFSKNTDYKIKVYRSRNFLVDDYSTWNFVKI